MPRRSVGVMRGRSDKANDPSLRDIIVDGEKAPKRDPETQIEAPQKPQKPQVTTKKRSGPKKRNRRTKINYYGALDDIIADIYEKEAGAYKIVNAVAQLFEARGEELPFEQERFKRICGNLALVQATREIAWLYGLGPEHADKAASLSIERFFGIIPKEK